MKWSISFKLKEDAARALIDYRQHVEKVDRPHLSLHAKSIDNNVGVAIRSDHRYRVLEMADGHGFERSTATDPRLKSFGCLLGVG